MFVEQIGDEIYVDIYSKNGSFSTIRFKSVDGYNKNSRGFYPKLLSRENPARGKFNFSGNNRACNSHSWLAIDRIEYLAGKIIALDLRFKQRCEFYIPGVYGVFHWEAP